MSIFSKNKPMVRLVYLNFEKKFKLKDKVLISAVDELFFASVPIVIPQELEFEDVCKMVSYLFENNNVDPNSTRGMDRVLDTLNKAGFEFNNKYKTIWRHRVIKGDNLGKDEHMVCKSIPNCVDIFVLGGQDHLFRKTKLSKRFVDWYVPSVGITEYQKIKNSIPKKKIH